MPALSKVPITHLCAVESMLLFRSSYLGHNANHWAFGILTYHVSLPSLRLKGATVGSCEVISVFLLNPRNDISLIADSGRVQLTCWDILVMSLILPLSQLWGLHNFERSGS